MSQQYGDLTPPTPTTPSNPPPPGLSWSNTWIRALTQPTEQNYAEIASDAPPGSNSKAYSWVFIATIIAALLNLIVAFVFQRSAIQGVNIFTLLGGNAIIGLICIPIQGLLSILIFAIVIGLTQLIAGAMGGKGTYSKLLYTTAAFSAPLTIVSTIIGAIPSVGLLNIVLALYAIVLDVLTIKAVNQFGWGKAILSSIVIWLLLLILVAVVIIVIIALIAPAIGNVFSNIVPGS